MEENIAVISREVSRHEVQISDILDEINSLSKSHAEIGFILKTFMERLPEVEKKLDGLGDKLQMLMPGKDHWELEKRLIDTEKALDKVLKNGLKFATASIFLYLIVILLNPEVQHYFLGMIQAQATIQ